MPIPNLTVDELVDVLKRTRLPTVLVEGPDDMTIYRKLEEKCGSMVANFLPCGGRSVLLALFRRRSEFREIKCAFLADRDMWLFLKAPDIYNGVIWTTGYSIENDLIDGGELDTHLSQTETDTCRNIVEELVRWFAYEVSEAIAGRAAHVDVKLGILLPGTTGRLCPVYLGQRGFKEPSEELIIHIKGDWKLKLRGKQVMQLYTRILCASGRRPQLGRPKLIDLGIRNGSNPHIQRIATAISNALV